MFWSARRGRPERPDAARRQRPETRSPEELHSFREWSRSPIGISAGCDRLESSCWNARNPRNVTWPIAATASPPDPRLTSGQVARGCCMRTLPRIVAAVAGHQTRGRGVGRRMRLVQSGSVGVGVGRPIRVGDGSVKFCSGSGCPDRAPGRYPTLEQRRRRSGGTPPSRLVDMCPPAAARRHPSPVKPAAHRPPARARAARVGKR